MDRHRLRAPAAALEIDPQDGGRWTSLVVDGLELLSGADLEGIPSGVQRGCFVMAPYAGRLGHGRLVVEGVRHDLPRDAPPHAIHGHVFDVAWQVEGEGVLSAQLPAVWPFGGSVRQELVLHDDGLDARLVLRAGEAMPATIGFHPWFARSLARGGSAELQMSPHRQYEKGVDQLPTGRLIRPAPGPYDDCFIGMAEPPRLVWPGALELTMTSRADHWVVFDQLPDVICLEPQTGPPDAAALGRAAQLPAGGELVLEVALRWR
jgi:aldose 1-epimerase